MDVPAWSKTNGTEVTLYDCHNGGNQLTVYGTKCPEEAGTGQGQRVQINDCTTSTGRRRTFNSNATVTNAASGLCMDAGGGRRATAR